MLVSDEVANVALDMFDGFRIFLGEITDILVCELLSLGKFDQFIGDVLVEDEAKDVVLVLIGFDLRPHLVGRFPNFGGKFLLIHCALLRIEGLVVASRGECCC